MSQGQDHSTDHYAGLDWVQMSLAERIAPTKALYRAFAVIAKRQGIKGEVLLFRALGETETSGIDYISNFRKGKIDKHKARDVHLWLAQNYFALAQETSPDLFPNKPIDPFQDFIDCHAITGKLRIVRIKNAMDLVQRANDKHEHVETLRLSEKFCFELDTNINGFALAFQRYQGQWYPLPLGVDQRHTEAEVKQGTNLLPSNAHGKPIPIEENDDTGNHQFAVVVSKYGKLLNEPSTLAALERDSEDKQVYLAHIRFVT